MWWVILLVVAAVLIATVVAIRARRKIVLFERGDKYIRLYPNPGVRFGEHFVSVHKGYRKEH